MTSTRKPLAGIRHPCLDTESIAWKPHRQDGWRVGIVGATGLVGQLTLAQIIASDLKIAHIHLMASRHSSGQHIRAGQYDHEVHVFDPNDFKILDIVIFASGSAHAIAFAPLAQQAGCWVIDHSSGFRNHKNGRLIIPQINGHAIGKRATHIIANPNCSTIAMMMALHPINQIMDITHIDVATYQAWSGAGREQLQDFEERMYLWVNRQQETLAPECIPYIGDMDDQGLCTEEKKLSTEPYALGINNKTIIHASCLRVPTTHVHGMFLHVKTQQPCDIKTLIERFKHAPGVVYHDNPALPRQALGNTDTHVSRLRSRDREHGFNCWVVCDNLLKGAASNVIDILKSIRADYGYV